MVVTFENNTLALIPLNDTFKETYNSSHVADTMEIQNQILGLQGFQNKLGTQYFEYIVLLELNSTDSHYYLRLLSIDHIRVYRNGQSSL